MVEIKLKGLKIAKGKTGAWYVYRRATGEALIQNFKGSRSELLALMAGADFIRLYNAPRALKRPGASELGSDTLGGLVSWYTNGDIDRCRDERGKFVVPDLPDKAPADAYPKWRKLARATRKDYLEAYDYLRDAFTLTLREIEQPDLYDLRDKCANEKWPRFADQMIAALSSMFKQGVKRGNKTGMKVNPCIGMDKIHTADPNANREWFPEEYAAFDIAPMEIKICLMLARYAGLRGQSIVVAGWKHYRDHPLTGKAFTLTTQKNNERAFLPCLPELQAFLAERRADTSSTLIAVRDDGTPWASEVDMQTRVSHWLREQETKGIVGDGTTLHGLRSSYAAWWKRQGASDREIADLLADKSERMGGHYSRHVERENNIIRAFERLKGKP
ncbi:integrase [Bradyrhizobium sp. SZCCHNS2005]|uniref:integrase n=1 Tax=Bradyrhizobium sp. SZCCHNS2005 TaxID=3057303 RepID=UPI0028E67EA5|nr:integrase [Bradyrhizobium sp. SZCCHNS2005]